jgi:RNA polymerase sigma-70 factor (ECF subfamily)
MENTKYLPDETKLVESAKTDEQAFVTLYDFYFPRIYAFVARRIGHRQETEDIVSETFSRAVIALPDLGKKMPTKFGGWLYRVAGNLVIDRCRRRKRQPAAEEETAAETLPDPGPTPEAAAQQVIDRATLERILAGLPHRDQEILHLRYFAELDNGEIAAALGLEPNNVGVLLHRAIQKASKLGKKYAR